jgi:SulP family sulfate permease
MPPALSRFLPFLAWRHQLDASTLRTDLMAGFTVALVAIPQALAYAQLAGLPPYVGLYASLLPCIVGALFGSSAQLNTGPVALTSLLTATSLAPLALPGSETYLLLAVQLALLAGILQVAFGMLRLAHFSDLLSHPVLHGFINACSLLICAAQLPTLLGLPTFGQRPFAEAVIDLARALPDIHLPSAALGLAAIGLLVALRRLLPRWPGVLIVVAGLSVVAWLTGFEANGGRVVGALPAETLAFALPRADWGQTVDLLPSAFVLALVSFLEAMSSCKVASARTGQRWDGNQELIGQGLAKLTASVCQAYPVSGSFGRSAFLLTSGARTGLASVVGALMVLAALLSMPGLIARIPLPVLAAVILVTLATLLSPAQLREAWRTSRDDGLAGTISFVATLAFAPHIEIGILAGLILSLALLIYRSMKPRVAVLGRHPDGTWRDAARFGLPPPHPELTILRFDGPPALRQRRHLRGRGARRRPRPPPAEGAAAVLRRHKRYRRQRHRHPAPHPPPAGRQRALPGLLRSQETSHRRDGAHRAVERPGYPWRLPHRRPRPPAPAAHLVRPTHSGPPAPGIRLVTALC